MNIYAEKCYKKTFFFFDCAKLMYEFEKMKKCKCFFEKTRKKFVLPCFVRLFSNKMQ